MLPLLDLYMDRRVLNSGHACMTSSFSLSHLLRVHSLLASQVLLCVHRVIEAKFHVLNLRKRQEEEYDLERFRPCLVFSKFK